MMFSVDDAEMHRIDADLRHEGHEDREHHDHDRDALDEHAEDEQYDVDHQQDHPRPVGHGQKLLDHLIGDLLLDQHPAEFPAPAMMNITWAVCLPVASSISARSAKTSSR